MYKLTNSSSVIRLSDGASIPDDSDNRDYAEYLLWLADGNTPEPVDTPPPPTPEQIQAALEALIQQRMDNFAQSVNFDNLASACLTGLQPVGTYRQADGAPFVELRYKTWQKAAEIRDAVIAGTRPEPTWEEIEAELPSFPIAV